MWWLKILLIVVVAYVAIVGLLYARQTQTLFPADLAARAAAPLPASADRLTQTTPDGDRLQGARIPPSRPPNPGPVVILGFGGNAWNADSFAIYLHELLPDAEIVAFHYRGYAPSGGKPSAKALLADSLRIYDRVREESDDARIIVAGFSLGSGIAAYLASQRPVDGLILVSPFDSMTNLAQGLYPWAPVRWLLRHRIDTAAYLRETETPTAIIAAADDTLVPPERTAAVRQIVPDSVLDRTIEGVGHNDLYDSPTFRAAMLEALARIKATWRKADAPQLPGSD